MKNEDTRERLIDATVRLLTEGQDAEGITARQICAEAQTNLAMINYFFKSKEKLMHLAVERIMASDAQRLIGAEVSGLTPRQQLRGMLIALCEDAVAYHKYARISVPFILLQEEITIPLTLLPLLRGHFNGAKSEEECRIIAYEMTSFFQLVLLRAEDFVKYSGMDVFNTAQRARLVDMQLDLFLGKET